MQTTIILKLQCQVAPYTLDTLVAPDPGGEHSLTLSPLIPFSKSHPVSELNHIRKHRTVTASSHQSFTPSQKRDGLRVTKSSGTEHGLSCHKQMLTLGRQHVSLRGKLAFFPQLFALGFENVSITGVPLVELGLSLS